MKEAQKVCHDRLFSRVQRETERVKEKEKVRERQRGIERMREGERLCTCSVSHSTSEWNCLVCSVVEESQPKQRPAASPPLHIEES